MTELWVAPTLSAAVRRLADQPDARPIAGGVGVLLARALGGEVAQRWVSVGGLSELTACNGRRVGAAATLEAVASLGIPLLSAASGSVANRGIRAVATIGGNVVAGGGASELAVALAALGAHARVARASGERAARVRLLSVLPGELVGSFELADLPVAWGWERLPLHGTMDRASVSVAVTVGPAGARVVAGCVADRVLRLPRAAGALAEERLADVREATAADVARADLLTDDRASAEYRRRVVPVLVERAARSALTGS